MEEVVLSFGWTIVWEACRCGLDFLGSSLWPIDCDTFCNIWLLVFQWLGISFVALLTSRDHFFQFGYIAGLPRTSHSFFLIIWLACVCVIWKEWNSRVFQQRVMHSQSIANKVKNHSFLWLKSFMPTFAFSYHDSWRHPFAYMSV